MCSTSVSGDLGRVDSEVKAGDGPLISRELLTEWYVAGQQDYPRAR